MRHTVRTRCDLARLRRKDALVAAWPQRRLQVSCEGARPGVQVSRPVCQHGTLSKGAVTLGSGRCAAHGAQTRDGPDTGAEAPCAKPRPLWAPTLTALRPSAPSRPVCAPKWLTSCRQMTSASALSSSASTRGRRCSHNSACGGACGGASTVSSVRGRAPRRAREKRSATRALTKSPCCDSPSASTFQLSTRRLGAPAVRGVSTSKLRDNSPVLVRIAECPPSRA